MAVITLNGLFGVGSKQSPVALTPGLSDFGPVDHSPPLPPSGRLADPFEITLVNNLPISDIEQTISLSRMPTFLQDYYYRIHIRPVRIDLGVVAAEQSRVVTLWNAYPDVAATLESIDFSQEGITYSGDDPPLDILPLAIKTWDLVITTSGPPNIEAEALWNFSDVDDPAPIVITGTRAIQFKYPPDIPVEEEWVWMTNVIVSVDGTEQRAGLRGVPRVDSGFTVVLVDDVEIRDVEQMLFSAQNRLWMPAYQYGTQVLASAAAGTDFVAINTVLCDVRVNEYIMLVIGTGTLLVQVAELVAGGVRLAAPLPQDIAVGTVAVPGSPSFITDSTQLRRYAVDEAAEVAIRAQAAQVRSQWARPGNAVALTTFDGLVVLDKRPLANSLVPQAYNVNSIRFDGDVGIVEILSLWDYTKISQQYEYLVHRVQTPTEMDYWKVFADSVRGALKNFLLPTWRNDLLLRVPMSPGANSATFIGPEYAEFYYKSLPHRRLVFTTAAGVHYAKVTSAAKTVDGDSLVVFTPPLPAGSIPYSQVSMVSLLLSQRIADDTIRLRHDALQTNLSFNTRTADP